MTPKSQIINFKQIAKNSQTNDLSSRNQKREKTYIFHGKMYRLIKSEESRISISYTSGGWADNDVKLPEAYRKKECLFLFTDALVRVNVGTVNLDGFIIIPRKDDSISNTRFRFELGATSFSTRGWCAMELFSAMDKTIDYEYDWNGFAKQKTLYGNELLRFKPYASGSGQFDVYLTYSIFAEL